MNATPPEPNRTVILPALPGDPAAAQRVATDDGNPLPPGARLGEFEILKVIGIGGFGIVYLAQDHFLERHVAVKEYMPTSFALRSSNGNVLATSPREAELFRVGMRSFLNEARLLARFDHPALLKVYRFWEANGTAYMAMPFYEGVTLKQAIRSGQITPTEEWIRAFLAYLLDAISLIHAAHCYHRDIAPDNIMLLEDGRPVLLDFGAARQVLGDLTHMPTAILKPGYAPIEQYMETPGMQQGPWTDVYALAAVVYYLITRKPPPPAVARIVQDDMLPARQAGKGRYRDSFLATLDHALAVRPELRIRSVAQFRSALGIDESIPEAMPSVDEATRTEPMASAARPEAFRREGTASAPERRAAQWRRPYGARHRVIERLRQWLAAHAPRTLGRRSTIEAMLVLIVAAALYGGFRLAVRHPGKAASAPQEVTRHSEPVAPSTGSTAALGQTPAATKPEASAAAAAPGIANPEKREHPSAGETQRREEELWAAVRNIDKPLVYESFLSRYPTSRHADEARASLARLRHAEESHASAASKAPGASTSEANTSSTARNAAPAAPQQGYGLPATPSIAGPTARVPSATPATPPPQTTPPTQTAGQASTPRIAQAMPQASPDAPASDAARTEAPAAQERTAPAGPAEKAPYQAAQKPEPDKAREPQRASETMSSEGRVLKLPGQTMTGNFTTDPVTGAVSGRGRIVWDNGDRFEGTLAQGVRQGKGEFIWANGQRYRGDWARGLPNGKGTMQFANGNRYEGEMRDGVPHGVGVIDFSNGDRYSGDVRNGLPDGSGTNRFANGDIYSGAWRMGKSHGHGRYAWASGGAWEGEFRDGVKTENGGMASGDDARPLAR
ncbi:serine/threonine-protein kinase [Noviherbaspirillum pedocola]|nr:serine/threonine-protein kinase [Noviherbaspirillum pedocola]